MLAIDWEKCQGLVPAIIQHAKTAEVLMLGYMNREALQQTLDTKKVTFFSRTKQRLWVKGETSGNYLQLVSITQDCDQDSLLIQVNPQGNTCHLDKPTCFEETTLTDWQFLSTLEKTIDQRACELPDSSYTASLIKKGIHAVSQKVGEEGVETVIAALAESDDKLCNEAADLIYHLLVLLRLRKLSLHDVIAILRKR